MAQQNVLMQAGGYGLASKSDELNRPSTLTVIIHQPLFDICCTQKVVRAVMIIKAIFQILPRMWKIACHGILHLFRRVQVDPCLPYLLSGATTKL